MKATLTTKGQITIPVRIRRRLHLQPGDVLKFDENAPFLKATRAFDVGRMRRLVGCCRGNTQVKDAAVWIRETRGAVSLPPQRKPGAHRR